MNTLQNLQQQTYGNQQAIVGATSLPPTGHAATFMNTGRYFMYRGGQGAIGYGGQGAIGYGGQTMGAAGVSRYPGFGGSGIGGGIMGGGVMGTGSPPTNPFPR